ncbi:MAG: hypothetical protein GX038_05075 [Erysipelothrix sp.]|nr:hypothetical protein [Erysipelothrix sp.]
MKLFKALFEKSKLRIVSLILMLSFVMVAIFFMFSLTFSKFIIQNRISERGLPHTVVSGYKYYNTIDGVRYEETQYYEWLSNFFQKEAEALGYRVEYNIYVESTDYFLEAYNKENYKVLSGKSLDKLEDYEIAIPKEFSVKFKGNPIGQTLYDETLEKTFTVASIIEYPNYELSYQPTETLSDIELFSEIYKANLVTSKNTIYSIRNLFQNFDDMSTTDKFFIKVYYDDFSYSKENELINILSSPYKNDMFQNNITELYTLESLTKSNPLPEMLKSALAKYVVTGIIISSIYAFYIHLKNQLQVNHETLTTFNLIGIKFANILKAYLKMFAILMISSTLITTTFAYILGQFNPIFKPTLRVMSLTYLSTFGFLLIIIFIFYRNLSSKQNNAHEKLKSKNLVTIKTPLLKQSRLPIGLAINRLIRTIGLMLGFAFSIGLSISMVLISLSSLNSISNIYHPKTFGITFDYILMDPDIETYFEFKDMGMDIAQINKNTNVAYQDYSINKPVDNVSKGSMITFLNEIHPFITPYIGEMPTHQSTWYGEDGAWDVHEVLASKRLMDTNDLRVYSDPDGPVDKHYLFTKNNFGFSEEALQIRGGVPTLIDRGFVSFSYRKHSYVAQISHEMDVYPSLVILNDKMDVDAFENYLKDKNISFVSSTDVMDEFDAANIRLNKESYDILLLISIAMIFQTIINLSGVLYQISIHRKEEDSFYKKIGISQSLLQKVNILDIALRLILSTIVVIVFTSILLPLLNSSLKYVFAITFLPSTLFKEIIIACIITFTVLVLLTVILSKYKKESNLYVKD